MTKFHIRDTGEPGRCIAAPGNCRYGSEDEHHVTAEDARIAYEAQRSGASIATLKKKAKASKGRAIDRAIKSKLKYAGPTPKWMESRIQDSKERFGVTPEVIDVIDSVEGKLAVVWEPYSLADQDASISSRGYVISRVLLQNMETGSVRGYLSTAHASDDSMRKAFGEDGYESLRFMNDTSGSSYGTEKWVKTGKKNDKGKDIYDEIDVIRSAKTSEELIEAKRNIWLDSHRAERLSIEVDGELKASYQISIEDAPTDEKQLDKDLKKILRVSKKKFSQFKEENAEPRIDYSKVEDNLHGTGVGSALYIYSARMHAKDNRPIRSSTIQTEHAGAVWDRFSKNDKLPIKTKEMYRSHNDTTEAVYLLDFRDAN